MFLETDTHSSIDTMDHPEIPTSEAGTYDLALNRPTDTIPVYTTTQPNFNLQLPIPSPNLYWDNYHHPQYPNVMPPILCYADPLFAPYRWPQPLGILHAHRYDILGAKLHDFTYVNFNPTRLFTKYLLWYVEINDDLIRKICPSDLNDAPCEWDELQGGCPMLRLCEMKHKYPHPHLGLIPACTPRWLFQCRYLHGVLPTCRSIARGELCREVVRGEFCGFGHDLESARVEAVERYWEHRAQARERGSVGWVKRDVWGRKLLRPAKVEVEEEWEDERE